MMEMDVDDGRNWFDDIPNEILLRIFVNLSLDDIKSCRLVDRRWYEWCEHYSIADREKFIIRHEVHSSDEINDVFARLSRPRIDVEFVAAKLDELEFANIEEKLVGLRITNCSIASYETLRNIFLRTPNIRYLSIRVRKSLTFAENDLLSMFEDLEIESKEFRNDKLATFEYTVDGYEHRQSILLFPAYELCKYCPNLRSIKLDGLIDLNSILESGYPLSTSVKELHGCYINFEKVIANPTFEAIPKLKRLALRVSIDFANIFSADACEIFFARQTELEELDLKFYDNYNEASSSQSVNSDLIVAHFEIEMLLRILEYCRNLKKFRYQTVYYEHGVYLAAGEDSLLARLISEIENLRFPVLKLCKNYVTVPSGALKNLKLKGLHSKGFCELTDQRRYFIQDCTTLERLDLWFECSFLSVASEDRQTTLDDILRTQTNLSSLKAHIRMENRTEEDGINNQNIPEIFHHLKLENLEFVFPEKILMSNLLNLADFFRKWSFPNLLSFTLSFEKERSMDAASLREKEYCPLKLVVFEWLQWMTTLTKLDIRFCCATIDECVALGQCLTSLRKIRFLSTNLPEAEKIITLFQTCRHLKCLVVEENNCSNSTPFLYYYSRAKERLYRSTLVRFWNGYSWIEEPDAFEAIS